ncbi:MAG: response regulator [Candidatus Paceibacterota bacterium]
MEEETGPLILIVEDDPLLSGLLAQELQSKQFRIRSAQTGEEGLMIAKSEKPDLMLLDILLPGIDGFEVLRQIKSDPELKHIRVIILSNLGQENDILRGTELGAERYIVKVTLSLAEVVQTVRELWQRGVHA